MKRCPKCGINHENHVITCDCGHDLRQIKTENSKVEESVGVGGYYSSREVREVIVTDVQIPFGSMVVLMIKWAFAAIPAAIIILIIWTIIFRIFGRLLFY